MEPKRGKKSREPEFASFVRNSPPRKGNFQREKPHHTQPSEKDREAADRKKREAGGKMTGATSDDAEL